MISGALLHDFGKTEELTYDATFDYSDKGNNGRCSSDVDADENNNTARIFCVLQNIQNRPELNGWIGVVVGYDPGVRRYLFNYAGKAITATATATATATTTATATATATTEF